MENVLVLEIERYRNCTFALHLSYVDYMRFNLFIFFVAIQISCLGQNRDYRVIVGEYAISQMNDKGHLYAHFTDSISRSFLYAIKAGNDKVLNVQQLQLAFYSVLFDPIIREDESFFLFMDSLSQQLIVSCSEFGFYQIVWTLSELREYYMQNRESYEGKPQHELFDASNENFDNQLYELRMDFLLLAHDFMYKEERLDVISTYLLAHQNELMQFYSNEK